MTINRNDPYELDKYNNINSKKKRFLSACLIAKDEESYLLEWIAFHRVVGFDYFYIYSNDSLDKTFDIANKLENHGICTAIDWPRSLNPDNPQVMAYRDAIARFGQETEWLAIMDADEFFVPLSNVSVSKILQDHFWQHASVACNWRVFGSSGHLSNNGDFCIDRFRKSSYKEFEGNTHLKCIVRPEEVEIAFIHNHYMKNAIPVFSDGSFVNPPRIQRSSAPIYGHLQVNHYYCKSREEFLLKRLKGLADYPLDHADAVRSMELFHFSDRNDCDDNSAARLLDATRVEVAHLMSLLKI